MDLLVQPKFIAGSVGVVVGVGTLITRLELPAAAIDRQFAAEPI